MKRVFDLFFSFFGLLFLSPLLGFMAFLIWLQDFRNPLYIATRVGKGGRNFRMVKLRSMVVNADSSGVVSTSGSDMRITPLGSFIRRFKLDEFGQLWNVLLGEMSFVGPRPQVLPEVERYTCKERELLNAKPGITDFASIVFADEGEILAAAETDADTGYNQLIRPWKSRLGLLYVENSGLLVDIRVIFLTIVGLVSREQSLSGVSRMVKRLGGG